jgi:hypothetical protein
VQAKEEEADPLKKKELHCSKGIVKSSQHRGRRRKVSSQSRKEDRLKQKEEQRPS